MTPDEFGLRLAKDCAVPLGGHVLAAVSGGADSTALLCFLSELRGSYPLRLSCAHVEHGIRGDASLADAAFVRALCKDRGIPFYECHIDAPGYARAHGCGLEDAARTLRYAFLRKTAKEIGADCIALAHHAQDQAETVLLHAIRGSDLNGLCAMRMRRDGLIRPLLNTQPEELRDYLRAIGQPWREDETNKSPDCARNRIRLRAMPELEAACPGAGAALERLARAASRDESYFEMQIAALDLRTVPLINGVALERAELCGLHEALLGRVLMRAMKQAGIPAPGAAAVLRIMDALAGKGEAVALPGGAEARIGARYVSFTRGETPVCDVPLSPEGETKTPFGAFRVRDAQPGETGDGKRTQAMPEALLMDARITSRREGDGFIPFGRHTPVKLKKLLIDEGVERAMRRSVPVLRAGEGIAWAVGIRPGEICRARPGERQKIVEFLGLWPGDGEIRNQTHQDSQGESTHAEQKRDICGFKG